MQWQWQSVDYLGGTILPQGNLEDVGDDVKIMNMFFFENTEAVDLPLHHHCALSTLLGVVGGWWVLHSK